MNSEHAFSSDYAVRTFAAHRDFWNEPVFEADSFVALPSLGSLVAGWLLVVPRSHALCMAALTAKEREELFSFVREIAPMVEEHFGPVAVFEHGPARARSEVGCGVDYAHLHIVPTSCDLWAQASVIAPKIVWRPTTGLEDASASHRSGLQYIFLQQPFGSGPALLGMSEEIPSQLFRRVIARHLGKPEAYDWKANPEFGTIARTLLALAPENHAVRLEPACR